MEMILRELVCYFEKDGTAGFLIHVAYDDWIVWMLLEFPLPFPPPLTFYLLFPFVSSLFCLFFSPSQTVCVLGLHGRVHLSAVH